ncbi:glycine/sarcosine/betaine reductase component B subunit [Pelagibaculum spongiae]|uniref:Beta-aspartyl-peptidase n=1 Tax=Pelagibaculum spongiae TaxID=2080658 RepID=A0A2V1GZH7_9GAMM|nr:glycine/sarcosine/betaine reductase component B subunit [Pelagibaculum spongiae]PVZ71839.1 beta-aspartyl-peptidase [Pelagibaculum spongiae]
MKLEIGNISVEKLSFGNETKLNGNEVVINNEELVAFIRTLDDRITEIKLDIALPGESTRIMPVKDVIEPRVKVSGPGTIFPGRLSGEEAMVGEGRTNVLKGMAVVTCGHVVGFQEGIIDMSGTGAEYTPFSKTKNLVVTCEVSEECNQYIHEEILRSVGLETAKFIGKIALEAKPDEVKSYETLPMLEQAAQYPELPKIGYVYMLQSQGLMHDTYLYGVDVKQILPTLIYPTEVMDGAIISGNCVSACDKNPTIVHQNSPIIHELYEHHGTKYNFMGVIITNENVTLADKERSSNYVAKLAEMMGWDAAIVSEEGFGNPDADLVMNCNKLTAKGLQTVLVTDEYAGPKGDSPSLADSTPKGDAVISNGNANMVVELPPMERIIGHAKYADMIAGGTDGSLREDGSIVTEIQAITGATNELGYNFLTARAG